MGEERYRIGHVVELLRDASERGSFTVGDLYGIRGLDGARVLVADDDEVEVWLPRAWVGPAPTIVPAANITPAGNPRAASGFASTPEDHAAVGAAYLNGQRTSRHDAPEPVGLDPLAFWQAVELVDMARAQAHLAMADHLARSPLSEFYRVRQAAQSFALGARAGMGEDRWQILRDELAAAHIGGISIGDRFANFVSDSLHDPDCVADDLEQCWPRFVDYVLEQAMARRSRVADAEPF